MNLDLRFYHDPSRTVANKHFYQSTALTRIELLILAKTGNVISIAQMRAVLEKSPVKTARLLSGIFNSNDTGGVLAKLRLSRQADSQPAD
ncbi:MAG TPA: hypothetical protein ENL03_05000 [Phycisphaerae bacterium]|nr:hypothetical protein [Phycisphaerae bacterium]